MREASKIFQSQIFRNNLSRAWDIQPFYIRSILNDPDAAGFKAATISAVFRRSAKLSDRTEVVNHAGRMPLIDFAKSLNKEANPFHAALKAGATIIGRRFDFDHNGTARVLKYLQSELGHPCFASIFITHTKGSVFPPHYDSADVFILHLSGIKNWKLFERAQPPPSTDDDVRPVDVLNEAPSLEYSLERGDLLYVPRGTIHGVEAVKTPAIHVSFGVKVFTIGDLFNKLLNEWRGTSEMRTALPPLPDAPWVSSNLQLLLRNVLRAATKSKRVRSAMHRLRTHPTYFDLPMARAHGRGDNSRLK